LIKFHNVSKKIGQKYLLENISFEVKKSEITTLIGPNGAGKTTIARLILGLDKNYTGKISIKSNIRMSYVPQKFVFSLDLPMNGNIFLKIMTSRNFKIEDIFGAIITENEMNHILVTDIKNLSGGQFQKLLIISAIMNKPDLLILDEPSKSLDINSQQELYLILNKIKKHFGTSIFMISHDLYTVIKNSDQVICLNGHVCCSGRASDIKNNPELIDNLSNIGFYLHNHDHKH
jgi:zinc transport system ATP-binding protein